MEGERETGEGREDRGDKSRTAPPPFAHDKFMLTSKLATPGMRGRIDAGDKNCKVVAVGARPADRPQRPPTITRRARHKRNRRAASGDFPRRPPCHIKPAVSHKPSLTSPARSPGGACRPETPPAIEPQRRPGTSASAGTYAAGPVCV